MMKKYLMIFALLIGSKSFAQTIPNGGFETWSNFIFFYEPQGFVTSNYASVLLGTGGLPKANVSRGTDKVSGTYSAKLESYAQKTGDTTGVPGLMITGALDLANTTIKPGFPISGPRPTELRGFYKYAQGNAPDSGIVTVALSKYDSTLGTLNVIGGGIGTFSNKSAYTAFTVNIAYTTNEIPDTAIIIISTTTVVSLDTAALTSAPVGSILYVDDLSFFAPATGLQSIDKLIASTLYPNPSTDLININFYQANSSTVKMNLIGIDGKVVLEQSQYLKAGKQNLKLDVSNVNAGMYQVLIITTDGTISKKVAVIK